ncbi:MAG TPA: TIGR00730 family Rossman fold protein [Rubrobacteraceae bacterium]|nr:TIGR00730 family Rossman fold protein [Rubrobacteraceae bacterium]
MKRVCVFCGSSTGSEPAYTEAARTLGQTLAREGITLVYGGGHVGLMGVVADAALRAGGEVVGVIPRSLLEREIAHTGLTNLRVVGSMHERKALMSDLSDGFIALPGGTGTLEEFFEVLTWAQLGEHRKPCGLLNAGGYYDPLLALFDHMVAEGFLSEGRRAMVLVAPKPDPLLEAFARYRPPEVPKWLGRAEVRSP